MSLIKKLLDKLRKKQVFGTLTINDLDVKLGNYLIKRGGFFIEAGANNGISQSNTRYFEKNLGWTGLLIEPIPELAEKCRKNRPDCIVENYALVSPHYSGSSIEMRYANLMSLVVGGMKTPEEEDQHIESGLNIQKLEESYRVSAPVATLSDLIEKNDIKNIDLLSLDVEGYELEVLKGLNFKKTPPVYILVEARYREEIDSFLGKSYNHVEDLSSYDVLYKIKWRSFVANKIRKLIMLA